MSVAAEPARGRCVSSHSTCSTDEGGGGQGRTETLCAIGLRERDPRPARRPSKHAQDKRRAPDQHARAKANVQHPVAARDAAARRARAAEVEHERRVVVDDTREALAAQAAVTAAPAVPQRALIVVARRAVPALHLAEDVEDELLRLVFALFRRFLARDGPGRADGCGAASAGATRALVGRRRGGRRTDLRAEADSQLDSSGLSARGRSGLTAARGMRLEKASSSAYAAWKKSAGSARRQCAHL